MATLPIAPGTQVSPAIVPMLSGLSLAIGMTSYWLMHPVWPCEPWFHSTPLTQTLIEPGYIAVFWQSDGALSVVYSPTT